MKVEGRAKGGIARARKLSASERRAIAKRGAASRWSEEELPRAICSSEDTPLEIAGKMIDCYVLEDGTRVLSQGGFLRALGRNRRAATRSLEIPPMLQGQAFTPYLTPEILDKAKPIHFRTPTGQKASGYRAELLPDVCEIYLKARDANLLASNQRRIAIEADILIRGLATVGIIALVDEATGYQEYRAKDALARVLEIFIAKELQPWLHTFPTDYYRQMFRLRGLEFPQDSVKRPQYFGTLTNDLVYRRLAPGVLDELRNVTERDAKGRPRHKYFQRLTSNVGYPKLRELLGSIVTIMKLSNRWTDFMEKIDRLHPRYGATLPLPLAYDDEEVYRADGL